jgi:agmatine deiminase
MTKQEDLRIAGWYMPAEWTPHDGCWMAWPCRDPWAKSPGVQRDYANVANTIARFETVRMLAPPHLVAAARALLNANVTLIEMPINDSWARDSGPNFLVGGGGLAGSTWTFNSWGGKHEPWDQDALMGRRILERVGAKHYASELVAEGGGVTVDGEGTVITTETCFLNANRNPGWTRREIEDELCRTLGATKVVWIPGDPTDPETDGHVDGICAFIEPGRLLVEINHDTTDPHYPIGQANWQALKKVKDARGRTLELDFIQEGIYHEGVYNGGCSSYVNSYLANGAVIVPGYGYEHDAAAVETYARLYPDREIVQVPIHHLATGGGGVHCVTQQQPTP